jgi:phosphatidylglycerol---prolipoprotein diacylglyceryl transferase
VDSPDMARWPGAEIPADLARWSGTADVAVGTAGGQPAVGAGATAGAGAPARAGATARASAPGGGGAEDVPAWAAKALEQLLTVTYWLDPGEHGEPFTATIRFTGHRTDTTGAAGSGDTFSQEETVEGVVPGSGPVAVTAEVRGVNPGTWAVTARPVTRGAAGQAAAGPRTGPVAGGRVPWPRRVRIPASPDVTTHTSSLLRSKVPGIIRYAYACLVVLGVLTGLGLEALLLASGHYPLPRPLLFSVAAVGAGVIGGKAWYATVHRGRKWDGWCIQGFVGGAAVVAAAAAIAGAGLPAGAFLAAATPALLIGMGIGRHGCFWAGCCTGRATASRWGIWSSDRRLGCRRMPVQLLEAWTALVVGAGSLAAVLAEGLSRSGPVAVAALAAYTLVRQLILGLRDEPRQWRHGRRVTAALAAIALIAGVALFAG